MPDGSPFQTPAKLADGLGHGSDLGLGVRSPLPRLLRPERWFLRTMLWKEHGLGCNADKVIDFLSQSSVCKACAGICSAIGVRFFPTALDKKRRFGIVEGLLNVRVSNERHKETMWPCM